MEYQASLPNRKSITFVRNIKTRVVTAYMNDGTNQWHGKLYKPTDSKKGFSRLTESDFYNLLNTCKSIFELEHTYLFDYHLNTQSWVKRY